MNVFYNSLVLADIGDLVVLMAKRRYLQHTDDNVNGNEDSNETTTRRVVSINQKMICHVFESDEVSRVADELEQPFNECCPSKAQSIAHSIGQAFQVAYVEFLKANGIDDPSFTRDIDYQEVLNQQEIGSEELDRFSKKECQKEVRHIRSVRWLLIGWFVLRRLLFRRRKMSRSVL